VVLWQLCDVSSLDSVRELAASVEAEQLPCHLLVNNAGVLVHTPDSKSSDGFEINFATNTLGTFALTSLLLPALKRAVVSTAGTARVVFVSSGGSSTSRPLTIITCLQSN
jgi:dehydrogenase/reductase SDR family protein 12